MIYLWLIFSVIIRFFLMHELISGGLKYLSFLLKDGITITKVTPGVAIRWLSIFGVLFYLFQFILPT